MACLTSVLCITQKYEVDVGIKLSTIQQPTVQIALKKKKLKMQALVRSIIGVSNPNYTIPKSPYLKSIQICHRGRKCKLDNLNPDHKY